MKTKTPWPAGAAALAIRTRSPQKTFLEKLFNRRPTRQYFVRLTDQSFPVWGTAPDAKLFATHEETIKFARSFLGFDESPQRCEITALGLYSYE